jgi:hypothetical protein
MQAFSVSSMTLSDATAGGSDQVNEFRMRTHTDVSALRQLKRTTMRLESEQETAPGGLRPLSIGPFIQLQAMLKKETLFTKSIRNEIVELFKEINDIALRTRSQAWVLRRRLEDMYLFVHNRLPWNEYVARNKVMPKVLIASICIIFVLLHILLVVSGGVSMFLRAVLALCPECVTPPVHLLNHSRHVIWSRPIVVVYRARKSSSSMHQCALAQAQQIVRGSSLCCESILTSSRQSLTEYV